MTAIQEATEAPQRLSPYREQRIRVRDDADVTAMPGHVIYLSIVLKGSE